MRYRGEKGHAWESVKRWCRQKFKHCYTCNARNLVSFNANAGHYRPVAIVGSNNKKSWDERFIKLQCGRCNGPGQGEQAIFRANLVKELGEAVVDRFDREVAAKKVSPVKNWQEVIDCFDKLAFLEVENPRHIITI